MSRNRFGNGGEVVVEVGSEEMEDGAKGSCPKGLESSAPNQISKVDNHVGSSCPEITGSSNAPISNEEESYIEHISSPAKEEEDEEIDEKVNKRNEKMVMEYIVFGCSLGVLVASFTVEKLENLKPWGLEMWKCCVLVMLIFCGMLVTDWALSLLVFVIEWSLLMKKKVQIFLWLGTVFLTWLFFFNYNRGTDRSKTFTNILDHITWTLVSLLIGAFLWMLSTLLFKILASKFMADTYFCRIQEILFHQHVMETLSGPPLVDEDAKIRRSNSTGPASLWRIENPKEVSVETMDTMLVVSSGKGEGYISKRYIEEEDIMRFMPRKEVDLLYSLSLGGALEAGKITEEDIQTWMVNVDQDRRALIHSTINTKAVPKQLEQFFTSVVIVITIVVWLLLVGIASSNLVVFLSTQFLLAAFMFGNTCKNVFEAIVFIFVIHPFDVGDRIVVDDVQLMVEEMNVLTTTFLKSNNEKVYYPNSILCTKTISNYYRSRGMGDTVEFSIVLTPVEKIDMLKNKIKEYLESKMFGTLGTIN
ncbi:PREDICTED: mechanosensitive ion channel protein 10-like [Fragaria vesca subsp. vesca]